MLQTIAVSGYRSLVDLALPIGRLTVVTGANGAGKSNLYRAVRLLAAAGSGRAASELIASGGLDSVLWAGPESPSGAGAQGTRRTRPVSLLLGAATDELGYLVDLGLPVPNSESLFGRDAELKREQVFAGPVAKPASLVVDRAGRTVRVRDRTWRTVEQWLAPDEGLLTDLADAEAGLELLGVRRMLRSWRFYDSFRADAGAPARRPRPGTRSHVLADDGHDLAAVWRTIQEAGGGAALDREVDRAFPGTRVEVVANDGVFALRVRQPGLLRPLGAEELSDGTLRYLLLCAALLSTRPAPFIVLNEPESSLHPELLEPLAALVAAACADSQVMVVTHAERLAAALVAQGGDRYELVNRGAGTHVEGWGPLDGPPWHWGHR
ncbi:AAA family ATPase [Pseudoclavibacter chungangensis]|uniref:AAA family ATPase n=1 Tax=Pseudoclavibacter chungangensis TaxID=587635 RepID=A0A7J5BPE2_9MICO|nr:AAA family ATPase [Pseudoclavibacter chungangensis]KAB1654834.1 AAA family ATPase [Pseudoclavibacter chungangensis]NYJ68043.1 putative ATPase [Pseudoclavibacter chungangensis]